MLHADHRTYLARHDPLAIHRVNVKFPSGIGQVKVARIVMHLQFFHRPFYRRRISRQGVDGNNPEIVNTDHSILRRRGISKETECQGICHSRCHLDSAFRPFLAGIGPLINHFIGIRTRCRGIHQSKARIGSRLVQTERKLVFDVFLNREQRREYQISPCQSFRGGRNQGLRSRISGNLAIHPGNVPRIRRY